MTATILALDAIAVAAVALYLWAERDCRRLRKQLDDERAAHALTFALLKTGNAALYRLACEHYGDDVTDAAMVERVKN